MYSFNVSFSSVKVTINVVFVTFSKDGGSGSKIKGLLLIKADESCIYVIEPNALPYGIVHSEVLAEK